MSFKKPYSLFFIFLIIAAINSSCAFWNKKNEPLSIGSNISEATLLQAIANSYGSSRIISAATNIDQDTALKALLNGSLDLYIGKLDVPADQTKDIETLVLTKSAIAIITHPDNPVNNLSKDELKKIFSRKIVSWKTINGKDEPIVIIDSGKTNLYRQTVYQTLLGKANIKAENLIVNNLEELKANIKKFPNAISYLGFTDLTDEFKAPSIDNVPADKENISESYFPLYREIYIYYHSKKIKANNKKDSLEKFLAYLYSDGQKEIIKQGYMPLTEAELGMVKIKAEPIYIGVVAPLDGSYVELGKSIVDAAKLAVEEVNDRDGIEGRPIELIVCNDKAEVKHAIDCAKKLIKNKVVGVIGHLRSQDSIEASKLYAEHKIVLISPASTHPWLTERPGARGYVFRTIGRDDKQAKLIADFVEKLAIKHPAKISIMNNSTVYGSTLSKLIENEISKKAIDKVLEIKALEQDAKQYHNEIATLDGDVLVFAGEYGDAAQIMKELALSNKRDIVFIGADGIFSRRFIELAGLRAEGAFVTGSTLANDPVLVEDFMTKFEERFNIPASAFVLNSYDATNILLNAISSSFKNGTQVNEEVAKISYQGITGPISFNQFGDPMQDRMCIYRVDKGDFVKK